MTKRSSSPKQPKIQQGKPRIENKFSSVLDDQPSSEDYLDFASYSEALKDMILHPNTTTPLTIGIYGRWGTGKTTLMQMLSKSLRSQQIITVWFNAWQYSTENELWAAFLQSVLNKMQADLSPFQKLAYNIRLLTRRVRWSEIPGFVVSYSLRLIVTLVPLIVSLLLTPALRAEISSTLLQLGGGLASTAVGFWLLARPTIQAVRDNLSIDFEFFRQESNYQQHIAFLDRFREHFEDIVQSLPQRGNKRLTVFIDDLDRCPPERTLQVLDAIKLFADIRGCVYVIGLDLEIVQKAIAIKYSDDPIAQREYLGKIIQLPFQLPPLTRDEMKSFVEQIVLDLPDNRCREVFVEGLAVNPREIKRTINIFSLLWNLASNRGELAEVIAPVRLSKVVVIQQVLPELHRILQDQPQYLSLLEMFFRDQQQRLLKIEEAEVESDTGDAAEQADLSINAHPQTIITLPESIKPFAESFSLRRILLMHELEPEDSEEDYGVNFAKLTAYSIAIYFTLTSRVQAVPDTSLDQGLNPRSLSGEMIDNRYVIQELLGHGGSSVVYLAYDQIREQKVVVKLLDFRTANNPELVERAKREISIMAELHHPHIVPILSAGEWLGTTYYVMPYYGGGTLDYKIKQGPLPFERVVALADAILSALSYIHDHNIVHRDIKPATILLTSDGQPAIGDFNVSMAINPSDTASEGIILGTPVTMAPEAWRTDRVDARADLYSFGVTMFAAFTGSFPYKADTIYQLMTLHLEADIPSIRDSHPRFPVELDNWLRKLMAKNRDDRYASAREAKKALDKAISSGYGGE